MQPVVFALALSVVVAVGVMVAVALPHLRGGAPVLTQAGWRVAWKVLRSIQRVTRRGEGAPPYRNAPRQQNPQPPRQGPQQPYPGVQQPHQNPQQPQQNLPQPYPTPRPRRLAPPGQQPADAGSEYEPRP